MTHFAVAIALLDQIAIGRFALGEPVFAGGEDNLGAFADQLLRPVEAEDFGHSPVTVEDYAIPDQGDADMRVVEDQSLLVEQRGHARLDAFVLRDVGVGGDEAAVGQR